MSSICVQKFGGSSLASHECLLECAELVTRRAQAGDQVVVVVSAMGSTTDQLLSLGRSLGIEHSTRTHDLLLSSGEQISAAAMSIALSRFGHEAVPLSGGAAGLITNGRHGCSDLIEVNPQRVNHELSHGRIPVVMGFQGMTHQGTLTVFGRGGSDTTAVALAGALRHPDDRALCEIYTDVDGIHTSDPRLVPHTTLLKSIGYQPMHTLSRLGAGVMAEGAIRHAESARVQIRVTNSRTPGPGTMISSEDDSFPNPGILACALTEGLGRILLNFPHASTELISEFLHLASDSGIDFDQLDHNESEGSSRIEYTAFSSVLDELLSTIAQRLPRDPPNSAKVTVERGLARIAVVGHDLTRYSSALALSRKHLSSIGIPTKSWSLDDRKCTFFVYSDAAQAALRATHRSLDLESTPK